MTKNNSNPLIGFGVIILSSVLITSIITTLKIDDILNLMMIIGVISLILGIVFTPKSNNHKRLTNHKKPLKRTKNNHPNKK